MTHIFDRPELLWFLIGLGLLLLELVIPGFFIFFFGLGAWVAALACLIWDPGTNVQIIIFAVTSVLTLVGLRRIITKKFFYKNEQASQDADDEFTGREAISMNSFDSEGHGKVEFKGTTWNAESVSPVKEGQRVVIIRKESFKLIVEPKNK